MNLKLASYFPVTWNHSILPTYFHLQLPLYLNLLLPTLLSLTTLYLDFQLPTYFYLLRTLYFHFLPTLLFLSTYIRLPTAYSLLIKLYCLQAIFYSLTRTYLPEIL